MKRTAIWGMIVVFHLFFILFPIAGMLLLFKIGPPEQTYTAIPTSWSTLRHGHGVLIVWPLGLLMAGLTIRIQWLNRNLRLLFSEKSFRMGLRVGLPYALATGAFNVMLLMLNETITLFWVAIYTVLIIIVIGSASEWTLGRSRVDLLNTCKLGWSVGWRWFMLHFIVSWFLVSVVALSGYLLVSPGSAVVVLLSNNPELGEQLRGSWWSAVSLEYVAKFSSSKFTVYGYVLVNMIGYLLTSIIFVPGRALAIVAANNDEEQNEKLMSPNE